MKEKRQTIGAKLGKRFGAYLLDALIIGVVYMIVCAIIGAVWGAEEMMAISISPDYAKISPAARLMSLSMPVIMFLYGVLFESGKKAATPGKRAAKLKVVKADKRAAKGLDIVVRNIIKALPLLLSAILNNRVMTVIVGILEIVYYIVPLCNKDHRAIHDFVGGTVVTDAGMCTANTAETVIPPIHITLPNPPETAKVSAPVKTETPVYAAPSAPDCGKTVAPAAVSHTLLGISGQYNDAEFPLDVPLVLGRESRMCNVIFANDTRGVSKVHCSVQAENGRILLKDLGSTYGITVNDSRHIGANESVELHPGDRFTIGKQESFVLK